MHVLARPILSNLFLFTLSLFFQFLYYLIQQNVHHQHYCYWMYYYEVELLLSLLTTSLKIFFAVASFPPSMCNLPPRQMGWARPPPDWANCKIFAKKDQRPQLIPPQPPPLPVAPLDWLELYHMIWYLVLPPQ
jgi:hypothetical protein